MKLSFKPVRASRAEEFQGPYGGSQLVLTLYRIYIFCFQMCNRLPEIMKNGDAAIFPVFYSLKYDLLLNRFKRGFLLNRDFGLRETSLKPNCMGFRQSVAGIKGTGRDARVVVPNRSVDRAFYIFYTILLCVAGSTPGAIPLYCCVQQ